MNKEAQAKIENLQRQLEAALEQARLAEVIAAGYQASQKNWIDKCAAMVREQPINTHVRLFDLVRYMRSELHAANLITDDEYVWLCGEAPLSNSNQGGSPSPRRLEDYDDLQDTLRIHKARVAAMTEELGMLYMTACVLADKATPELKAKFEMSKGSYKYAQAIADGKNIPSPAV